jgi:hypothetical protein
MKTNRPLEVRSQGCTADELLELQPLSRQLIRPRSLLVNGFRRDSPEPPHLFSPAVDEWVAAKVMFERSGPASRFGPRLLTLSENSKDGR